MYPQQPPSRPQGPGFPLPAYPQQGYPQQGYPQFQDAPPRRSRTGLIIGLVVLLAFVAGTGAGLYFGVFRRNSQSAAGSPFGDLASVDPCGFYSARSFADADTDVHIQPVTLSSCLIELQKRSVKGGYEVRSFLGRQIFDPAHPPAGEQVEPRGALLIGKPVQEAGQGECQRDVVSSTGLGLNLISTPIGDAADSSGAARSGFDPCEPADAAVAAVVAAVSTGNLPRLSFPADSLGRLDLCSILPLSDIRQLLSDDTVTLRAAGDPHQCDFTAARPTQLPRLRIAVNMDTPSYWTGTYLPWGERATIADRPTKLDGESNFTYRHKNIVLCRARTIQRTWDPWPGRTEIGGAVQDTRKSDVDMTPDDRRLMEDMEIDIFRPTGSADKDCDAGVREVAAKVWPKLPAISSN